jgi:hypothetical protein
MLTCAYCSTAVVEGDRVLEVTVTDDGAMEDGTYVYCVPCGKELLADREAHVALTSHRWTRHTS